MRRRNLIVAFVASILVVISSVVVKEKVINPIFREWERLKGIADEASTMRDKFDALTNKANKLLANPLKYTIGEFRCPDHLERDVALCYPRCKSGYTGVGPVCWQDCPNGFRDDGAYCAKPYNTYGRGAGYVSWQRNKCEKENSGGCEKWGAFWYPKCREGYTNHGCCICSPYCPNGMTDIGVSCQKNSYGRGVGEAMRFIKEEL